MPLLTGRPVKARTLGQHRGGPLSDNIGSVPPGDLGVPRESSRCRKSIKQLLTPESGASGTCKRSYRHPKIELSAHDNERPKKVVSKPAKASKRITFRDERV